MNSADVRHAELVERLTKPGPIVRDEMSGDQAHLTHMVMGVSGEAGELLDAIKKHVIYQKPLDMINVIEELGDLEFYLRGLRDALRVSRAEVLEVNIRKLNDRYGSGGYSNQQAIDRTDKT